MDHAEQSSHELRAIADRLARIETKLDELMLPTILDLKKAVYGTGDETNPGLVKEVDRLLQAEKRRVWVVRAMLGATVTTLGGWAWQFISAVLKAK